MMSTWVIKLRTWRRGTYGTILGGGGGGGGGGGLSPLNFTIIGVRAPIAPSISLPLRISSHLSHATKCLGFNDTVEVSHDGCECQGQEPPRECVKEDLAQVSSASSKQK